MLNSYKTYKACDALGSKTVRLDLLPIIELYQWLVLSHAKCSGKRLLYLPVPTVSSGTGGYQYIFVIVELESSCPINNKMTWSSTYILYTDSLMEVTGVQVQESLKRCSFTLISLSRSTHSRTWFPAIPFYCNCSPD
jgi:hypothetical protein